MKQPLPSKCMFVLIKMYVFLNIVIFKKPRKFKSQDDSLESYNFECLNTYDFQNEYLMYVEYE